MNNSVARVLIEEINKDRKKYAKEFSEGNKDLEQCLLTLWENGIYTKGCCIGHGKIKPYVGIDLNNNIEKINILLSNIEKNNIRISFVRDNNNKNLIIKSSNLDDLSIFKKIINAINGSRKDNIFYEDLDKIFNLNNGYYSIVYYLINENIMKKLIITNNLDEISRLKNLHESIVLNEKNNIYQFKLI